MISGSSATSAPRGGTLLRVERLGHCVLVSRSGLRRVEPDEVRTTGGRRDRIPGPRHELVGAGRAGPTRVVDAVVATALAVANTAEEVSGVGAVGNGRAHPLGGCCGLRGLRCLQ